MIFLIEKLAAFQAYRLIELLFLLGFKLNPDGNRNKKGLK